MGESVIHTRESAYPGELEPDDANRASRIRSRTFVGAGRTATSGLSLGVFELPPGAVNGARDRCGVACAIVWTSPADSCDEIENFSD